MNKIYGIPDKDYFFDNWIIIFLALYFLFPIGIILLLRKIHLHRRNLFTSGKIAISIGTIIILIGFLFLYVISIATNFEVYEIDLLFGVCKFFWIIGYIVLAIGILTRLAAKRYQKYIKLVINESISDLDIIANKMNYSKKIVIKHLNKLIGKRYLQNYIIEVTNNRIYYFKEEQKKQSTEERIQELKEKYTKIITCKNCGANNLIVTKIGKCSYCNSYIE